MTGTPRIDRIVIDALQVPAQLSGVGREVIAIGADLAASGIDTQIVLRAPRDVASTLAQSFGPRVRLETPIARSRPRWRRIAYQQLIAPTRDPGTTMLVCPGDQGPLWGRARVVLAINDLRRLVLPATAGLLERLFYRVVQPASVRRASAIVTLTEFIAAELQGCLRPSAPVVVAAAHPVAPAGDREAPGPVGGDVLMVGALRPYKGVEDAIEALARVDDALVHRLLVIGSDERRGASIREHAAAHGVADRVRLCGWVSDDDLEDHYRTALAVIAPSHYE